MEESKDLLQAWMRKIPKQIKICFITGMLTGFITHLYMLTQKLTNCDDVNNMYSHGISAAFGRWFLDYTDTFAGMWSNPWLHGIFTIVMLSLAACVIVATLHVKSTTSAVLIPAMLLSYPALASTMTYMWLVDAYALGILLACFGAYLIRRFRWGFVGGIVCIILATATYQSFVCFTAGLLVFGAIVDMLEGKTVKTVFIECVKYLGSLGAGLVLYVLSSKLIYPNMSGYNGISEMGKLNLLELPVMILRAYKRVLEYFVVKPFSFVSPTMQVLNIMTCILLVLFIVLLIRERKELRKGTLLFLILLLVLAPLSVASIYIMAADATMSLLMLYQYCLISMMAVVLLEKWLSIKKGNMAMFARWEKCVAAVAVVSFLLLVYQNYLVSNEAYFRMQIANERATAYYNRIMTRVEEQDGYQYGDKITLMGEFFVKGQPNTNPLSTYRMDDERYVDFSGIALENQVLTTGVRRNFLRFYLGIEIPEITAEEVEQIQESEAFANMPDYPANGSIQKINDIWVVRLCYDWESYQESVLKK